MTDPRGICDLATYCALMTDGKLPESRTWAHAMIRLQNITINELTKGLQTIQAWPLDQGAPEYGSDALWGEYFRAQAYTMCSVASAALQCVTLPDAPHEPLEIAP